jgi:hypothetical protein
MSSVYLSSPSVEQDQQSTFHKASDSFTSNMAAGEPYDLLNTEFNGEDTLADPSMGHITPAAYRQQHDLLGLALQTDNNGLPANEVHWSKEVTEAAPYDQKQTFTGLCPIYKALLAEIQSDVNAQRAREVKHIPMERYLAEDLAERYALISLGPTQAGEEWERYSRCLCVPF